RFGPLRFNLSKSGIGLSAGVKGARIGIRPDGHAYTNVGRYGLYYRQELGRLGSVRQSASSPARVRPTSTPSPLPDAVRPVRGDAPSSGITPLVFLGCAAASCGGSLILLRALL